jgi:RNA recognition motif-containing protein
MEDEAAVNHVPEVEVEHSKKENENESEKEQARRRMHTDAGNTIFIKGIPAEWKEEELRKIINLK